MLLIEAMSLTEVREQDPGVDVTFSHSPIRYLAAVTICLSSPAVGCGRSLGGSELVEDSYLFCLVYMYNT